MTATWVYEAMCYEFKSRQSWWVRLDVQRKQLCVAGNTSRPFSSRALYSMAPSDVHYTTDKRGRI
jgi:hypothetical protein